MVESGVPCPGPTRGPRPRTLAWILGAAAAAILALGLASAASAAEPPNQNDPCSTQGRNTCAHTGVGSYERYRYGIRWFGDYRGVAPVAGPTFCTDLRFWYPSRAYRFREVANEGFTSREGKVVSTATQRRMAYALWNYGRSRNRDQQAAVMLYVHSLVGDGAPGEVDPSALGPSVEGLFAKISRESARLHGPYRIEARISRGLTAGTPATGTVKLVAAGGAAVPDAVIELDGQGVTGLPARVRTGDDGVAELTFTPAAGSRVSIEARSESIASDQPRFFAPTVAQAARNGQRLVAPASQRVSATATQVSSKATIGISTSAFPDEPARRPGQPRPRHRDRPARGPERARHRADPRPLPHPRGDPVRRRARLARELHPHEVGHGRDAGRAIVPHRLVHVPARHRR